ncbi:MAG: threonine/serine exporter family protein [Candidatus Nanopelagicales bacterium]
MISLWAVLWAAPAATGFAMMFNVRKRALPIVAAIAVLARFITEFAQAQGVTIVVADYFAAVVVGALAYTLGPRTHEASPVYAFAPVIPLIPGAILARALQSLLKWINSGGANDPQAGQDFLEFASSGFTAAAIVLVLCLGALTPMLLLPRSRTAED